MSSAQALRSFSGKQRKLLLSQVRRFRHVRTNQAVVPATVVGGSQPHYRFLHAEAGVAAASVKAGVKAGAHDWRLAALAFATASGLAFGSSLYPNKPKDEATKETIHNNNVTTKHADAAQPSATAKVFSAAAATAPDVAATSANCEPQRTMTNKPRNAMVISRKSLKGRGLYDKYNVDWDTVLGEGAYGSVHPARLAATGEKVALKRISKRYTNVSSFQTETDALFRIFDNGGHPNISGLRDMYDDHNYYYLILDLVTGGEMLDHLIENGAYSEADAARLMHEVASAMAFLHGVGVIHADLKPENLLLSTKNRLDGTIKIIDFGCAVLEDVEKIDSDPSQDFVSPHSSKSASSTGTTAYWPPERFSQGSFATPSMDMWSVGVILYIMLTGCHPFDLQGISTDEETESNIRDCDGPPLDEEIVGHLSESAIDLIKRLMAPNPDQRITAYDMLHHPWVRGETATREKIQDSDKKLSQFREARNKLEAGMFAVLLSQAHSDSRISEANVKRKASLNDEMSVDILKRAFDVFDAEGKGFVNIDDLGRVTREKTGSAVSSGELEEVLSTSTERGEKAISGISLSQFGKLFSGLRHKHFPRGHYIFHAGERGDAMYFISSGKVEIQTRKGQLVSLLRSGDFFGEGCLLENEGATGRFTSAKCMTPVDAIEINRADFERYIGASESARREVNVKWRARSLQYAKNLLRLQKNVEVKTYKKGQAIYKEGDLGTIMYRVDADDENCVLDVSHGGRVVHHYLAGDSFGESSLLFRRPRSSSVTCASKSCRLYEMKGEDFLALVESNPEMAQSLRDMSRKRLLKRAVKNYSLSLGRGTTNADLVQAFHDADVDKSGALSIEELRRLMHRMDPNFPDEEIRALLKFVDVDNDGQVTLLEFRRLFRQFEDELDKSGQE